MSVTETDAPQGIFTLLLNGLRHEDEGDTTQSMSKHKVIYDAARVTLREVRFSLPNVPLR